MKKGFLRKIVALALVVVSVTSVCPTMTTHAESLETSTLVKGTQVSVPYQATKITSIKKKKNSLTIKWKAIPCYYYFVQVSEDDRFPIFNEDGSETGIMKEVQGKTKVTFKKLKSNTKYYVRVVGVYPRVDTVNNIYYNHRSAEQETIMGTALNPVNATKNWNPQKETWEANLMKQRMNLLVEIDSHEYYYNRSQLQTKYIELKIGEGTTFIPMRWSKVKTVKTK